MHRNEAAIIINRVAFNSREIMELVASCPSICMRSPQGSPAWTVWPTNLIFGMGVDLYLSQGGILVQGRGSKVKVKCQKSYFGITVALL